MPGAVATLVRPSRPFRPCDSVRLVRRPFRPFRLSFLCIPSVRTPSVRPVRLPFRPSVVRSVRLSHYVLAPALPYEYPS